MFSAAGLCSSWLIGMISMVIAKNAYVMKISMSFEFLKCEEFEHSSLLEISTEGVFCKIRAITGLM